MRALPPTAGDLRGLAFEHGAVPSAVVRLDGGLPAHRARERALRGARGRRLRGPPAWTRSSRATACPGRRRSSVAAATGDSLPATVGERAVEIGGDGAAGRRRLRDRAARRDGARARGARALGDGRAPRGHHGQLGRAHLRQGHRGPLHARQPALRAPLRPAPRGRHRPHRPRGLPARGRDRLRGPRPRGHADGPGAGGRGARDRRSRTAAGCRSSSRCSTATGARTRSAASRPTSPTASAPRPRRATRARRRSAPTTPRASSSRA